MSAQNTGTDLDAGQAVSSIGNRGNDDFASLIGGGSSENGQKGTQSSESTAAAGTNDKPELTKTTLSKSADEGHAGTQGQTAQQTGQQTQQQTTQASTAATAAPTASGLSKEHLDQIVDTAARAAAKAANPDTSQRTISRDQAEMTPEQFNAKYGIETITEAHMQRILDSDPKKAAAELNRILVKNLGSSALMAKDIVDVHLKKMQEQFQPHVDWVVSEQSARREAKMEADFYEQNKDLVNEKPLVKEMQSAIFGRIASGQLKPFNSPQDALKAVADATRALVQKMGRQTSSAGTGAAQQSTQSQQGQQQQSSSRQMTAASSAGQSGTGQTAGQSDVEKIFGSDFK